MCRRIGDLRLRLPVLLESYNGTINATQPAAKQCPQLQSAPGAELPPDIGEDVLAYSTTILPVVDVPEDEDCMSSLHFGQRADDSDWTLVGLTFNVQVPSGTKPGEDKLPVLVVRSYSAYQTSIKR